MTTDTKERNLAGLVETVIVGRRHTETGLSVDEPVTFRREPDNPHDTSATAVVNRRGDRVGYLPRRVVAWLAPLIDQGKVSTEGTVARRAAGRHGECPLDLRIAATALGSRILEANQDPRNLQEALHRMVVSVFEDAERLTETSVVLQLSELLQERARHDMTAESRLLLALVPRRVKRIVAERSARATEDVQRAITASVVAAPIRFRNLTLFPIIDDAAQEPDYILLSEAIETGDASVREMASGGSVPELVLVNKGARPILAPEGMILIGAMQNRTLNVTVLVGAYGREVVPVSCVERGRWSAVSAEMAPLHFAPPRMRAQKNASVRLNRERTGAAHSDQEEVWSEVDNYLRAAGVKSRTNSLTDAFQTCDQPMRSYRESVHLPRNTKGIIAALGSTFVGLEQFDSAPSFASAWPSLAESLFLEAVLVGMVSHEVDVIEAEQFRSSIAEALSPTTGGIGLGQRFEVTAAGLAGAALYYRDSIQHLSAFATRN